MKLGFAKTPLVFRITSTPETPPSATPSLPLPCDVASSAGFLAGGLDKATLILFRPIRCESSFSTACNAEDYICTIKKKDEWGGRGGGEGRGKEGGREGVRRGRIDERGREGEGG